MCASYGLGGGPYPPEGEEPFGLPPLDERKNQLRLNEWMQMWGGKANTTRTKARNLNPLIREVDGKRQLDFGWWWLFVNNQPAKYMAFNSRDDKLTRSWAGPFKHRRAILPATWYNEKGSRFELPDGELFGIAAIYTVATTEQGDELVTYSMVTRDAVGVAVDVHDRMPMLLPRDFHDAWLDPARVGDRYLVELAQGASAELSERVQVVAG